MPRRSRRRKSSTSTTHRRAVSRRPKIDPEAILASIVDEVVTRLGLDILGLSHNGYLEILRPIVDSIVSSYTSRPPKESIISKILNNPRPVYMYASVYLLERFDKLNSEQVEFIIVNAPEIAARYVSRLYREAVRDKRQDLLALLRSAWEQYGRPTPVTCPYCGFRAVMPDYVCMVCGREVREQDLKVAINFNELLKEYVELHGEHGVREALEKGYVVLRETLYPPSAEDGYASLRLYLTREERDKLRAMAALQKDT